MKRLVAFNASIPQRRDKEAPRVNVLVIKKPQKSPLSQVVRDTGKYN